MLIFHISFTTLSEVHDTVIGTLGCYFYFYFFIIIMEICCFVQIQRGVYESFQMNPMRFNVMNI